MQNQRDTGLLGAVLDNSIVVSAFLSSRGASAEILRLWREEKAFQIITFDPVLEEMIRVLLQRGIAASLVEDFVTAIHLQALVTDNLYIVRHIQDDPSDDMFLAAALEGQAEYIVTLDRHLLRVGPYNGIHIVRPARFLELLRSRGSGH